MKERFKFQDLGNGQAIITIEGRPEVVATRQQASILVHRVDLGSLSSEDLEDMIGVLAALADSSLPLS